MAWQTFDFKYGHAPDLPTTDPNCWHFGDFWPLDSGMGPRLLFTQAASAALNTAPLGAFSALCPDSTQRWWGGTATKLYEWNGSASSPTVTDRSGTAYSASTTATWSFAQYGASTLAVNTANTLQFQTQGGSANFANADSTAPKGNIVVCGGPSSIPLAVVFGYDDGSATPDGWFCSPTPIGVAWTPSIAANIAKARLLNPTGKITAAIAYKDGFLAFKNDSMWWGQYDSKYILSWQPISHEIGCVGKNAVCSVQDKVYFANRRGFFVFDGSYPRLIDGYVHDSWSDFYQTGVGSSASITNGDFVYAKYDKDFSIVCFWATEQQNANPTTAFYYNVRTGQWSVGGTISDGTMNGTSPSGEPSVLATFREGFNFAGFGCAINAATAGPLIGTPTFSSPVIGGPGQSVLLRGIWPQFNYRTRYLTPFGPSAGVKWAADGTITATSYQDSKNTLVTATPFTVNAQTQTAHGTISGPYVQASSVRVSPVSGNGAFVFNAVALDLQGAGKV